MLKTFQSSVIDHTATGAANRGKRSKSKVSIRKLAEELGLSAPYLSDLERGRRNWSVGLDEHYEAALKRLTKS